MTIGNLFTTDVETANNFFFKQEEKGQQSTTPVPGVKDGVAEANPQDNNIPFVPQSTESAEDIKNELAKFAVKEDNDPNKQKQDDSEEDQFTLPSQENFNEFAGKLTSNIKIDEELATKALGGDTEAFKAFFTDAIKQTIGLTMQASTAANFQMQQKFQNSQVNKVTKEMQSTQEITQAEQAALAMAPVLQTQPERLALVKNAISDARKTYPTAPTELIVKHALSLVGITSTQQQQSNTSVSDQNDEMDWIKHTSR